MRIDYLTQFLISEPKSWVYLITFWICVFQRTTKFNPKRCDGGHKLFIESKWCARTSFPTVKLSSSSPTHKAPGQIGLQVIVLVSKKLNCSMQRGIGDHRITVIRLQIPVKPWFKKVVCGGRFLMTFSNYKPPNSMNSMNTKNWIWK